MESRSRSELIDLLSLVFSIKLPVAACFETEDDIARETNVPIARVHRMKACGLIRPNSTGVGPKFTEGDAIIAAVTNEILELGADDQDLVACTAFVHSRCGLCADDPCATRCDAVAGLRSILARLEATAARPANKNRLYHLNNSIDALIDLV